MAHISEIENGDAIMHNGHLMTVCNDDIKRCSFMGISIFGDSYRMGRQLVERVTFSKCFKGLKIK